MRRSSSKPAINGGDDSRTATELRRGRPRRSRRTRSPASTPGAAIVHNHIDVVMVPGEESADRYLEGWRPVFDARPDALIYPTTNFGPGVEGAVLAHGSRWPRSGLRKIGIIDPGSVNFGGVDDGRPPRSARHGLRELVRRHSSPGESLRDAAARSEHRDLRAAASCGRQCDSSMSGDCRRAQ